MHVLTHTVNIIMLAQCFLYKLCFSFSSSGHAAFISFVSAYHCSV